MSDSGLLNVLFTAPGGAAILELPELAPVAADRRPSSVAPSAFEISFFGELSRLAFDGNAEAPVSDGEDTRDHRTNPSERISHAGLIWPVVIGHQPEEDLTTLTEFSNATSQINVPRAAVLGLAPPRLRLEPQVAHQAPARACTPDTASRPGAYFALEKRTSPVGLPGTVGRQLGDVAFTACIRTWPVESPRPGLARDVQSAPLVAESGCPPPVSESPERLQQSLRADVVAEPVPELRRVPDLRQPSPATPVRTADPARTTPAPLPLPVSRPVHAEGDRTHTADGVPRKDDSHPPECNERTRTQSLDSGAPVIDPHSHRTPEGSGREPDTTALRQPAHTETRATARTYAVAPDPRSEKPAGTSVPARQIDLLIGRAAHSSGVHVRLTLDDATVRVTVRTTEAPLNQALRSELELLVNTITSAGMQISTWTPAETYPQTLTLPSDSSLPTDVPGLNTAAAGGDASSGASDDDGNRQQYARWVEELMERLRKERR